jgi:hypothetical protein
MEQVREAKAPVPAGEREDRKAAAVDVVVDLARAPVENVLARNVGKGCRIN